MELMIDDDDDDEIDTTHLHDIWRELLKGLSKFPVPFEPLSKGPMTTAQTELGIYLGLLKVLFKYYVKMGRIDRLHNIW